MVRQLGSRESSNSSRTSRWYQRSQRLWYRRVVSFPRRQPTSRAAPHAHLSLASGIPLVLGWSHTVTSGAYHGASLWFTTLCALSVALGALSYNLMAVLAEFFNFDHRSQRVQTRTYLHGVDVTNSRFLQHPSVLAAVDFAAEAHAHQRRKTGEPYVTHCIETALIVEACLPPAHSAAEQERHVSCIMAAVLHDVIDDTPTDLTAMQQAFGPRVAALAAQVSKLSQMNQLLRRGKRQGWAQYSPDHLKQLRKLIVDLASEEPLVVLVKLADRLHNMRTVYVLPPDKQRSVAEETSEVWVSMAESLGWDGLKSEMEDLCFAVLQPSTYCTLRAELDRLWSLPTLTVVEEQLEDDAAAAAGPGGGSDLGLRIVQVSGPEAPVRHYTRAAGVRAAAAAQASIAGTEVRQHRRRRGRGGQRGAETAAVAEAEEAALQRARAVAAQAAVAAAAVPLPPPSPQPAPPQPAGPAGAPAAPALAVAAVAAAATAPVAVLELDSGDGVRTASGTASAAASAEAVAAVAVADQEPAVAAPRSLTCSRRDGGKATPAAGLVAQSSSHASPCGSSSTETSSYAVAAADGAAAAAAAASGRGWTVYSVRHSASPSTDTQGGSGAGGDGSTNSTSSGADASGSAMALASYSTLESVDGPLLLDSLVLPLGLGTTAAGGAESGGSSGSSVDGRHARADLLSAPLPFTSTTHSLVAATSASASSVHMLVPASEPPASASAAAAVAAGAGAVPKVLAAGGAAVAADGGSAAAAASSVGSPFSDRPPPPCAPLSPLSPQQERLKLILSTVVPFESVGFKDLRGLAGSTRRGLEVLDECAALLYNEIQIRSQAGGLGINIQGRLKSLHSVYRKMLRKNVAVAQVYDSRALRVIVCDGEGSSLQEAVEVCYRLVGAVHSIWKPIKREFDDYIANPKQSGYQALHTAVRGPGGIPMEVQIKTSSMHELAEYGAAAHWVYKEYTPVLQSPVRGKGAASGKGGPVAGARGSGAAPERLPAGYVGQPVLKVAKDKLRYGVVVSRQDDGQRLIAAVKLGATSRPFPTRVPDYSFYSGLVSYTRSKGWQVPGHGDLMLRLEEYVQCDDGRYHRRDHLGCLIPAETITVLEGYEEDATAASEAAAQQQQRKQTEAQQQQQQQQQQVQAADAVAVPAEGIGGGGGGEAPRSSVDEEVLPAESSSTSSVEQRRFREQMRVMFLKTQRLRSMLAWGEGAIGKYAAADYPSDEVSVLIWPGGRIEHFARGTTAGDIVAEKGLITTGEGYDGYRVNLLINVNNRLVPEDTVLNDGDLVILAREKVRI